MFNRKVTRVVTQAPGGPELLPPLFPAKRGPRLNKGTSTIGTKSTTPAEVKETPLGSAPTILDDPDNPFKVNTPVTPTQGSFVTAGTQPRAQSSPPGQSGFALPFPPPAPPGLLKAGTKPITAFKGFYSIQASQGKAASQKRKSQDITGGGSPTLPLPKRPASTQPELTTRPDERETSAVGDLTTNPSLTLNFEEMMDATCSHLTPLSKKDNTEAGQTDEEEELWKDLPKDQEITNLIPQSLAKPPPSESPSATEVKEAFTTLPLPFAGEDNFDDVVKEKATPARTTENPPAVKPVNPHGPIATREPKGEVPAPNAAAYSESDTTALPSILSPQTQLQQYQHAPPCLYIPVDHLPPSFGNEGQSPTDPVTIDPSQPSMKNKEDYLDTHPDLYGATVDPTAELAMLPGEKVVATIGWDKRSNKFILKSELIQGALEYLFGGESNFRIRPMELDTDVHGFDSYILITIYNLHPSHAKYLLKDAVVADTPKGTIFFHDPNLAISTFFIRFEDIPVRYSPENEKKVIKTVTTTMFERTMIRDAIAKYGDRLSDVKINESSQQLIPNWNIYFTPFTSDYNVHKVFTKAIKAIPYIWDGVATMAVYPVALGYMCRFCKGRDHPTGLCFFYNDPVFFGEDPGNPDRKRLELPAKESPAFDAPQSESIFDFVKQNKNAPPGPSTNYPGPANPHQQQMYNQPQPSNGGRDHCVPSHDMLLSLTK
ncbi:hypothetical protein MD484_g8224, partial [Candolleomyces efflorescens]